MARPRSRFPTELELDILKTLWRSGPATVRQVREALEPQRSLAHTSVMTVMNIMVDKGLPAAAKGAAGGKLHLSGPRYGAGDLPPHVARPRHPRLRRVHPGDGAAAARRRIARCRRAVVAAQADRSQNEGDRIMNLPVGFDAAVFRPRRPCRRQSIKPPAPANHTSSGWAGRRRAADGADRRHGRGNGS